MIIACILLIIWDAAWLSLAIIDHSWLAVLWIVLLVWAFFLLLQLVDRRNRRES